MSEFEYEYIVLTPLGMVSNVTSTSEADCFAVRAFIDLKEMRQKYEKIYVKLVSWLYNSKPGERTYLKLVYQKDDTSLVDVVTIQSTDDARWRKVGSDWVDLLAKVPEARTEEYGHFWQKVWVSGGSGFAHGVTVLIKGAKRSMPKDAITFLQGGLEALRTEIKNRIEAEYREVARINELISFAKKNFSVNVNGNWALTCLSTVLIESIIRDTLAKLGLEDKGSFKEIADRLSKYARSQGVDLNYAKLVGKREERVTAVH